MNIAQGEYHNMFLGPDGEPVIPEGLEYDKEKAIWKYSSTVNDSFDPKEESENSSARGSSRRRNETDKRPDELEFTPFKAREIPKEVKIDVTESSPLKRHKQKLDALKNKKNSINPKALHLTLEPPKEALRKEMGDSRLSVTSKTQPKSQKRQATFKV